MTDSKEVGDLVSSAWIEKPHIDGPKHCAVLEEEASIGPIRARISLIERAYHKLAVVEIEAIAPNGIVFRFSPKAFRDRPPRSPLWKAIGYVKEMEGTVLDYLNVFYPENRAA